MLLAAFATGFVYDFVWARCVHCVQLRKAALAANLGVILYACTLMATVLVVEKCVWAIIVYGIGNWVGVYLAIKWKGKCSDEV